MAFRGAQVPGGQPGPFPSCCIGGGLELREHWGSLRERDFSSPNPRQGFLCGLRRQGRQVGGCLVKKGETSGSVTEWLRWWEGERGAGTPRSRACSRLEAVWELWFQVRAQP